MVITGTGFLARLESRSAERYTRFFQARLAPTDSVIDCGCGDGSITVGLAEHLTSGRIVGVDLDASSFEAATHYAVERGLDRVSFLAASMEALPIAAETFSACLCHSSLETLADPLPALLEIKRVLKPGGLIGVASVEYGGLILAGPQLALLQEFYALRERVWELEALAAPRRGRDLRGLLHAAGYRAVEMHGGYVSHGTEDAVLRFGQDRAADCGDPWLTAAVARHRELGDVNLERMRSAWLEWSRSPAAFAAFAWCRALARKP